MAKVAGLLLVVVLSSFLLSMGLSFLRQAGAIADCMLQGEKFLRVSFIKYMLAHITQTHKSTILSPKKERVRGLVVVGESPPRAHSPFLSFLSFPFLLSLSPFLEERWTESIKCTRHTMRQRRGLKPAKRQKRWQGRKERVASPMTRRRSPFRGWARFAEKSCTLWTSKSGASGMGCIPSPDYPRGTFRTSTASMRPPALSSRLRFRTHKHTHTHKHTKAHTSTQKHTQAHTSTHTHKHTHTQAHTSTHKHTQARSLYGCASYCFCYLQRNTPAPYPYREPHTRSARPTGRCCGWASSGRKDNPDPIACQALHTPRPQGDQRACHRCCWFVSDFFFTSLGIVCIELGFRPPFTQTHTHTHTHSLSLSLFV